MGKGGQIWLKCTTVDLIMMIRYKKNIFERVENFHADLAWNHPVVEYLVVEVENMLMLRSAERRAEPAGQVQR